MSCTSVARRRRGLTWQHQARPPRYLDSLTVERLRSKRRQGQRFVGLVKRKNVSDQGHARVDKSALRTGLDLAPAIADLSAQALRA